MNDTRIDEQAFEADASAIGAARTFATSRASSSDGLAETVALVTSELASNAVQHARTPFVVRVDRIGGNVRVSVFDRSERLPAVRRGQDLADAVSGRGLVIVEKLAQAWGVDVEDGGKWVWAVLDDDGGPTG